MSPIISWFPCKFVCCKHSPVVTARRHPDRLVAGLRFKFWVSNFNSSGCLTIWSFHRGTQREMLVYMLVCCATSFYRFDWYETSCVGLDSVCITFRLLSSMSNKVSSNKSSYLESPPLRQLSVCKVRQLTRFPVRIKFYCIFDHLNP